jgi:hypothetical protein
MANVTDQYKGSKRRDVAAFNYNVCLPVRSGVTLYAGAMIGVDSTGLLNKADAASNNVILGRLKHPPKLGYIVGDGVIKGEVECGVILWANSGTDAVDANDVGRLCFVEFDQTVSETGSTTSNVAGIVFEVTSEGVWVIQGLQNRFGQIIALNATTGTGTTVR